MNRDPEAPPDVVVVGGAGHVGLPLSLALAKAGHHVGILDRSERSLEAIASGRVPFLERGADAILTQVLPTGRLTFSTESSMVEDVRTVVVVIGTPLDEFMNPSMAQFDRVIEGLLPHLGEDALLILRSTVFPGTTHHVQRLLKEGNVHARVAYCPERIAQGHAIEELASLPQVVGADDPVTLRRATDVFLSLGARTVPVSTSEAEFVKLFTNAWRYMKFAVANQFFMIADSAGVDYDRVLHAIRHEYPRAADLPGPGFAAGPCLLKDTMQLAAFTPDHFPMGQSARQINEGLPAYLVGAIERRFGDLAGRHVGILGMAFKGESDDSRDSLSFKLRRLLTWAGAEVLCTDPYVADERFVPLGEVLERADILVVGAPHRVYREVDLTVKPLVDVWGISQAGITV